MRGSIFSVCRLPVAVVLVCGMCLPFGDAVAGDSLEAEGAADVSADEKALRDAAREFVEAYNAHDAARVAALFGEKARLEDADGTLIEGRSAIEEAFAASFEANPDAAVSVAVDSLRFLTPDVAVESGSVEFFPDGATLTSRSRYYVVHLRRDGAWRMIATRTLEPEVLSNYEHLRALEWMVGDWIDEGSDSVVETSCRWDENKSFLLQDFQIRIEGDVTIRGTQRIGWDPQAKQIRAWVFDTAGGFGEAWWTDTGDEWIVKASGVSGDGISASATRRYRRLDGDHIIVSTTDRVAGGERLPDIEVTLVRKPPQPQPTGAGE